VLLHIHGLAQLKLPRLMYLSSVVVAAVVAVGMWLQTQELMAVVAPVVEVVKPTRLL
jgi:hypothetical protein